ncbi:hypothetical protein KR032_001842, partial [Drosophila birchii]
EGQNYKALLDSGATISCIGGSAAQNFLKHKNIQKCSGLIRATNGTETKVVSKYTTSVKYEDKIDDLELFIILDLKQDVYLGIDFWQKFGLLNKITSEPAVFELDIETLDDNDESPKYHELNEEEKRRLDSVVNCFPSFSQEGLGRTNLISHTIDVGKAKPVKQRHFTVSPAVEKAMYAEIDRMLQLGVIKESDSSWSSPIFMVTKLGKWRMCIDYRLLNDKTEKDAYPVPRMNFILDQLREAKYISTIDLKAGYWQIPMD